MTLPSIRFVEMFNAVVERGSFAAAATQLGVTPAAISRAISRQEANFGVRLLERTTRSMALTEPGRRYYEQCQSAIALLERAEREIQGARREPRGHVRISAPTTYAHYRLPQVLREFAERYPRVDVELNAANHNVRFTEERAELAIRRGLLDDSSLVARKLEDVAVATFASPSYLARRGVPDHPSALPEHACLPFVLPSTGRTLAWGFVDSGGRPLDFTPPSHLRCSGDFLACLALARAGAGVVQGYRFLVEEDLRQGTLVEILQPYAGRTVPFSLVRPNRGGEPLAVRLLSELILERLSVSPARRTPRTSGDGL